MDMLYWTQDLLNNFKMITSLLKNTLMLSVEVNDIFLVPVVDVVWLSSAHWKNFKKMNIFLTESEKTALC
jgi:hypothetical protein